MSRRVVVTGMGCISPVGNNVKETWKSILAGKSGAAMITHFDASKHKTRFAAEVKGFDPVALFGTREARKMDRFTQFANAVVMEALEHANLKIDETNRDRIGVVIGSGIGGIGTLLEQVEVLRERGPERVSPFLVPMMISDSAPGMIAIRFGVRGPNMALATACASGNNAIGEALEMIRRGAADHLADRERRGARAGLQDRDSPLSGAKRRSGIDRRVRARGCRAGAVWRLATRRTDAGQGRSPRPS